MYTFSLKSASSTFSRHCILLLTLLTTQSCPTLEIPRSGYFLGSPVLDLLKLKYTFPPPVQVWSRLSVLKFCCSFTHCVTDCLMSPKEVWAWQASHCVCECQHEREQAGNDGGQSVRRVVWRSTEIASVSRARTELAPPAAPALVLHDRAAGPPAHRCLTA